MSSKAKLADPNTPFQEFVYEDIPFPVITHIDQVRNAVGAFPEFAFRERDGFIFCCYKRISSETFPLVPKSKVLQQNSSDIVSLEEEESQERKMYRDFMFRREVRGLAFDMTTGRIVSRQLHKFFNVGERIDTSEAVLQNLIESNLKKGRSIHMMEKLDGSLVSPVITQENKMRMRTKMGFNNDTSNACEMLLYGTRDVDQWPLVDSQILSESYEKSEDEHQRVLHFCAKWSRKGYSCMFEFFTNETMIVIKYEKSFFTLIAMRNTETGEYVSYDEMVQLATQANISVVPATVISHEVRGQENSHNIKDVIAQVKQMSGKEGCVMRFYDGQMFKLKSDWYCDLHYLKSNVTYNPVNEGNIWNLVFDERVDDSLPLLAEREQDALRRFNDDLLKAVTDTGKRAIEFSEQNRDLSARDFASAVKKETRNTTWARILYKVQRLGPSEATEQVIEALRILLFKDLNGARIVLQAPHLVFFENYLKAEK